MSENIQDKWEIFNKEAQKKLKELEEMGSRWMSYFDELEKSANDLISEAKKELEPSSDEARKVWQRQIVEASIAHKMLRIDLEKKLEAVKRSEEYLKKAVEELVSKDEVKQ